jgi:hypothetical protein
MRLWKWDGASLVLLPWAALLENCALKSMFNHTVDRTAGTVPCGMLQSEDSLSRLVCAFACTHCFAYSSGGTYLHFSAFYMHVYAPRFRHWAFEAPWLLSCLSDVVYDLCKHLQAATIQ